MSLFRKSFGRGDKKKAEPAARAERGTPTLGAPAGETRWDPIRAKVQSEICAILARTILETIRSSQARTPSMADVLRGQGVNRLYADVLYDFLAGGETPDFDPSRLVLGWAREAMETRGDDRTAASRTILAALEAASRDPTLRKAAVERLAVDRRARTGPPRG